MHITKYIQIQIHILATISFTAIECTENNELQENSNFYLYCK